MDYRVSNGQSTVDITLQLVGDFNSLISFLEGNDIPTIDFMFKGGEVIQFEEPITAEGINNLDKGYMFNTSDPIIQSFGDYNNDYNNDYL